MKITQIRRGVFETNSSSTHSVTVYHRKNSMPDIEYMNKVTSIFNSIGEFSVNGGVGEFINNFRSKVLYLLYKTCHCKYGSKPNEEKVDNIKAAVAEIFPDCKIDLYFEPDYAGCDPSEFYYDDEVLTDREIDEILLDKDKIKKLLLTPTNVNFDVSSEYD